TCYGKEQKTSFGTIYIDRGGGTADAYSGLATVSDYMTVLGEGATATFNFTIEQAGTYDIAVRLAFPFWDKNALNVAVDGSSKTFSDSRLWWPYWRRTCCLPFAPGRSFSSRSLTLTISGAVPGHQFHGLRVGSTFFQ